MPTYQYACTQCDDRLEAVQAFSDAALTECPACQGRLRKVYSAVGVVFKGSGFYKNDSRSANGKDGAGERGGEKAADKVGGEEKGCRQGQRGRQAGRRQQGGRHVQRRCQRQDGGHVRPGFGGSPAARPVSPAASRRRRRRPAGAPDNRRQVKGRRACCV